MNSMIMVDICKFRILFPLNYLFKIKCLSLYLVIICLKVHFFLQLRQLSQLFFLLGFLCLIFFLNLYLLFIFNICFLSTTYIFGFCFFILSDSLQRLTVLLVFIQFTFHVSTNSDLKIFSSYFPFLLLLFCPLSFLLYLLLQDYSSIFCFIFFFQFLVEILLNIILAGTG